LPSLFIFDVLFAAVSSFIEAVGKSRTVRHLHIRLLNSAAVLMLEL